MPDFARHVASRSNGTLLSRARPFASALAGAPWRSPETICSTAMQKPPRLTRSNGS